MISSLHVIIFNPNFILCMNIIGTIKATKLETEKKRFSIFHFKSSFSDLMTNLSRIIIIKIDIKESLSLLFFQLFLPFFHEVLL